jgi:ribosomal protein L29
MTRASEFRDLSKEELESTLEEKQKSLFDLINKREKEKKIDKPHLFKSTKRDIARILTILTEKGSQK